MTAKDTLDLLIEGQPVSIPTVGLTTDEVNRLADGLARSVESEYSLMIETEWAYGDYTAEQVADHLVDYAYACAKRLRQRIVSGRVAE